MSSRYQNYFKGRDFVHQIGFYAPDGERFAREHNRLFGSGPYFTTVNKFSKVIYRGKELENPFELRAYYGAWGSHSVEVVQQLTPGDSMYTDYNDMDKPGINHLHVFVESLEEAKEACEELGIPIVVIGYTDISGALEKCEAMGIDPSTLGLDENKIGFMVVDMTEELGMMVQLIDDGAKFIHDMVINAGKDWDGETDFIREMG
ncbi:MULTISPECIES: VOC family protein [unclassified Adlercreutzia]|uniref:VOC family protein n=1 Tax=unclassified Adlercreutzia TaxID=2636013 RepID=UPI0013ED6157|nr:MULTISPECIES: VOC family protein [unclassified Adlercreutzia]